MRKTIGVVKWVKNEEDFHGNLKSRSFEKLNKGPNKLKYVGNIIFILYWSIFGSGNIINLRRLRSKIMEGSIRMKQGSQSLSNSLASSILKTSF